MNECVTESGVYTIGWTYDYKQVFHVFSANDYLIFN